MIEISLVMILFFAFHNNSIKGCSQVRTELSWIAAAVVAVVMLKIVTFL